MENVVRFVVFHLSICEVANKPWYANHLLQSTKQMAYYPPYLWSNQSLVGTGYSYKLRAGWRPLDVLIPTHRMFPPEPFLSYVHVNCDSSVHPWADSLWLFIAVPLPFAGNTWFHRQFQFLRYSLYFSLKKDSTTQHLPPPQSSAIKGAADEPRVLMLETRLSDVCKGL